MKHIVCIVQQHMFDKAKVKRLQSGLRRLYKENYSTEPTKVLWMIMPKGYAFSERKESNATILLIEVDENITKEKREGLMTIFSNHLLDNFDISPLDSIITVANTSYIQQFMAGQQRRVAPSARFWIKLKTLFFAIISKLLNGYVQLRVRM